MSIPSDLEEETSSPGRMKQPKICYGDTNQDETTNSDRETILAEQMVSIPLILKKILQRLPKRELLKTALVSKDWNFLSREVLRAVKNSLSTLNVIMCGDLTYLDSFILKSKNIPFNGLRLTVAECECTESKLYCSMSMYARFLLSKIKIKYLTVEFEEAKSKPCISICFLQELITRRVGSLEGLCLKRVPSNTSTFSEIIGLSLEGKFLPNIKFLKFPRCDLLNSTCKPMPKTFVKELVQASPKLQKLYGTILTTCLEFLLPMKLHRILEEFNFQPILDPLDLVLEFALEQPKLKCLRFSTRINEEHAPMFHEWSEVDVEKVGRILNLLLHSSELSLESLSVDNLDLLLMTQKWGMPVLKNVTKLHLQEVSGYVHNNEGFQMLHKLEWSKIFPNLKEIWVTQTCSMENYDREFYMGRELQNFSVQYTCDTVTKFVIAQNSYTQLAPLMNFAPLKNLFPNASSLYVDHGIQNFRLFSNLSVGWPDLKTYICKFEKLDSIFNFDDYFAGIGKEEANYVVRNIEPLETLEIVPKHPCLLNLPELTKLEVHLKHNRSSCNEATPRKYTMFVSCLTGHCVFSRMPNLSVEIHRKVCTAELGCHLALNHLKPFAVLVDRDDDRF